MSIKSYGLFWRRDEVNWNPGRGARGEFCLLGRRGENRPNLRVADFRHQYGIYILYGNHGSYYVGQTTELGLGARLRDHCGNDHSDNWDRFSWFGFCSVLKDRDDHGLCRIKEMAQSVFHSQEVVIADVEALLIRAMGLRNIQQMNFHDADEWLQVKADEAQRYMERIAA